MTILFDSPVLRQERRETWRRWFAWRPIRVSDTELVWLETVERVYGGPMYEGGIWYEYRRARTEEQQ